LTVDRATVAERYATAATTGTDADVLLAAGMAAAAQRDKRLPLALKIYRMGVTHDIASLWSIAEECDDWLQIFIARKNRRPMPKRARRELIVAVLQYFMDPRCGYCYGAGTITEDDEGKSIVPMVCESCAGTGKKPLAREVPRKLSDHAAWLLTQIEQHAALIHNEMAKKLRTLPELAPKEKAPT
jgi:hypothetical protein